MPGELRNCLQRGRSTTLLVCADVDDNPSSPDDLREQFWRVAQMEGIRRTEFDLAVFAFARDRLENWIQFLETGATNEETEGPRVRYPRQAADAGKALARMCKSGALLPDLPPSLSWSCENWRALVRRMR